MSEPIADSVIQGWLAFKSAFESWTPANWISFGTACVSLVIGLANIRSTSKRERQKNKREEFNRRVAIPIENSLELFRALSDDLHDCIAVGSVVDGATIEGFQKRATAAQRKLSRDLRFAIDSQLCLTDGWDVGTFEYDRIVEAFEATRSAPSQDQLIRLRTAAQAIERHDKIVRDKINDEIRRYT